MRHRVYGKHLSRDNNQRQALFRSLIRELFLHESIQTTAPKAKAIKGLVDTLIVKGKKNDQASQLVLKSFLVKPELVKRVTDDISPRYTDRPSGFTTMVRLGARQGDGAMMVKMSLVEGGKKEAAVVAETPAEEAPKEEKKPARTRKAAVKKETK